MFTNVCNVPRDLRSFRVVAFTTGVMSVFRQARDIVGIAHSPGLLRRKHASEMASAVAGEGAMSVTTPTQG